MARSGIYKTDVLRARNALIAEGRNPSIDAIREALGHTGSKATIHKYLQELAEEDGGRGKTKVSEPLQDLVARLAERLRVEADERIQVINLKHMEETRRNREALQSAQAEVAELKGQIQKGQLELNAVLEKLERTKELSKQERTAAAVAQQKAYDLEARLTVETEVRNSLEKKHAQARESLEHFRTTMREHRDHELRKHDQEVRFLRGEVKTLQVATTEARQKAATAEQVNAHLAADVARLERELSQLRDEARANRTSQSALVSAEATSEELRRQVAQLRASLADRIAKSDESAAAQKSLEAELQQAQTDLAAARSAATVHQQILEAIQGMARPRRRRTAAV